MDDLDVTTPGEREIVMRRAFGASREQVFDAFTNPETVPRWMWAFDWPMAECAIDVRVGGAMRLVWRKADGQEMGLSGTYREVERPARIVHTELFDQDWTGGETEVTTAFEDQDGVTTVTVTTRYASTEGRDAAMAVGMADGVRDCYAKLDALLAGADGP